MKVKLLSPVQHDGKGYAEGETVDIKDKAQADALIACGAAESADGRKAADDKAE